MQLIATVIRKRDRLSMQKQSPQPLFLCRCIDVRVTGALISRYRVTRVQCMYADLMRSAGLRLTLHQTEFTERS